MIREQDTERREHINPSSTTKIVDSQKTPFLISNEQIERLKQLEGQCKVESCQLLALNYPKFIFFIILMTVSVVGLLLLKYYKRLRVLLFYTALQKDEIEKATHIYIKGYGENEQICCLQSFVFQGAFRRTFIFKYLRYEYYNQDCLPLGMRYIQFIDTFRRQWMDKGLDANQIKMRQAFYGRNEHRVQVPNYFQYLLDVMTQPFFIFQYLVSAIFILQNKAIFGIIMIASAWLTTSINYFLLWKSYLKIKQTAQKEFEVTVLRNGQFMQVHNVDLVCGDFYIPHEQIPCDSIILAGNMFIDQASLTGQNQPIPKLKLEDSSKVLDRCHWAFQGSIVKTKKERTLALAVNIGFGSQRGRIIRKILTKVPKQPQFFMKLIYFLLQVMLVSFILFGATVYQMLTPRIQKIMIFLRFLDFITYSFPAPLPLFFNLTYSFCLLRLNGQEIYGTQAEKTIESSRMKTLCFDKTGTLTENKMMISKIFAMPNSSTILDVTNSLMSYPLITDLFACCNSVEKVNQKYEGDEIDLKMFHQVQSNIVQGEQNVSSWGILREVRVGDRNHEILRINEYQSRFQSMSVLFRHKESNRYFVAAKGNPQMVHYYSQAKIQDYDRFLKKLSLEGYRSIAFSIRQIQQKAVTALLKADRQDYLKDTNILGVVTFINLLKPDARSTIDTLTKCEINTKIITGDNIFLGVQTAFATGIIANDTRVIIIQGVKCKGQSVDIVELIKKSDGQFQERQCFVEKLVFSEEANAVYAIDNDYITSHTQDFLHHKIKVFARISPENKALIVRKLKEKVGQKMKKRTFWKNIFGQASLKIGMVGDGANDLIAIKQADVGIGITNTDAVYSATFALKELSQIIALICESKNTERQIVDLTQFYCIGSFINITSIIIRTQDFSGSSGMQVIIQTILPLIIVTMTFGFSRPAKALTKYLPNSNFMGLENQLVFWLTCALLVMGQVASYFYYYNTSDFVANPYRGAKFAKGWYGITKSSTIIFLIHLIYYSLLPVVIYRSSPWKEQIYKNRLLTILIILNTSLTIILFFFTKHLTVLQILPIGITSALVVLSISVFSILVCKIVNYLIERYKFHEAKTQEIQQELQSHLQ